MERGDGMMVWGDLVDHGMGIGKNDRERKGRGGGGGGLQEMRKGYSRISWVRTQNFVNFFFFPFFSEPYVKNASYLRAFSSRQTSSTHGTDTEVWLLVRARNSIRPRH